VLACIDEEFDLFAVIGKPHANTSRKGFGNLYTASPIGKWVVSRKFLRMKLRYAIDLPLGPNKTAGFSHNIGICFHQLSFLLRLAVRLETEKLEDLCVFEYTHSLTLNVHYSNSHPARLYQLADI
jgi:hypothetical protein